MYAHDANSDGVEESEQKSHESIGKRVKLRRQKPDDKRNEGDNMKNQTLQICLN